MSQTLRRLKTHKKAKEIINGLYDNDMHCLIVHFFVKAFMT